MRHLSCLILLFVCLSTAEAQQALYVRPGTGLFLPMDHLMQQHDRSHVENNYAHGFLGGGMDILFRINDKTDVYAGYQRSSIGFSYRIDHRKLSTETSQHEFPFGFEWLIKDVWLHRMDERPKFFGRNSTGNGAYYLALFRVKLSTGVSLSTTEVQEADISRDFGQYEVQESIQALRRNNFSVFGGITLQFYNRKRDKLHLSLLYKQGIGRITAMEIVEDYESAPLLTRLGSRGSYFSAQLKIPLRLASFGS